MITVINIWFRDDTFKCFALSDIHNSNIDALNISCEGGFVVITDEYNEVTMIPSDLIKEIKLKVNK